ncbi:MAG: STAS domain-containing protein [Chloroflexi bacterium]|nr:STAS domain-containing protein [Chloroflexota bacterium]
MEITIAQQAGVCILSIRGRVDSLTSDEMEAALDEQIRKGEVRLVAVSQVDYMSSSGLRSLLTALRHVRQQRGELSLAGLHSSLQQMLELAGFTNIFKIYPTTAEAVSAFERA